MALTPGTKVGPYEVLAQIGAGGMGEVYRARDTRLDRVVAMKALPSGTTTPQALERFEREAKAIAALNHPNICSVYDVGTAPAPYLVMELLEGESLHERLTRGPLDVALLVDTALALADAIAAAHARGIVHRDLKPSNVVLTPHGPKILDFGLARVVEGTTSPVDATAGPTLPAVAPLTEAGVIVGTVAYMSPEQLRGEALDARTDIFSLGLVLYEMATGQRAFVGGTSAVVSAAILHEHPRAPRTLRPDLPASLEQAILTALEKDRDTRTQTATELRAELKRIKRELGGLVALPATAPPSSSSNAQVIASVTGRHRRTLAWVVAVLLLVGVNWLVNRETRPALSIADLEAPRLLTTSGTARAPAISPQGDELAYVEFGGGADSLWVMQMASGGKEEIVPSTPGISLAGVNFTPNGEYVDYLRRITSTAVELWRIPTLGRQPPRLLAENVASGTSWSPDGRQMAYVRTPSRGRTELVIADNNASVLKVVATRDEPLSYSNAESLGGPAWSPDGSAIALVGRDAGSRTGQIVVVDVATETARSVATGPPGFAIALAWLDGKTLLLSMLDKLSAQAQLWTLPYPRGKYGRLTNDTSQYVGLSVTADRNEWVTSRLEASFGVWTSESGSPWREMVPPTTPAKASIGFGLRWIGDDLLFVQGTGTGLGVVRWRASTRKTDMLAPGGGFPSVSRDGSTIVYFHFDKQEQWRMDGDGSNPVRLGRGTFIPSITPDGRQVVVAGPRSETVRLIPTDATGIDQVIKSRVRGRGEVSPDGQRLAFEAFDEQDQSIIALCDLPTCSKRQPLPPRDRWHWTPDGRGLAYVDPVTSNLWFQPIDGGTAKPLRDFPNDGLEIWDFDWSADGNRLAVARARISWDIVLFRRLRPSE